jgi:putative nucleotidyltransferase with HDIG domain
MALDLLPSVEQRVRDTISTLFDYVATQGQRPYAGTGERVSQLEHSLQCAALAKKAGADEETILAALLHDIGHFLPQYKDVPTLIAPGGLRVGRKSHDKFGEAYLRQLGFRDKLSGIVGGHVMAKRYLTAVDPAYYDGLSPVSKSSLMYQGGPMTPDEVKARATEPYLQEKLDVRVWDDLAKDPDAVVEGLDFYKTMALKSLTGEFCHTRRRWLRQV